MIVKNEAALLERCLSSIKTVADEIVIVDTGSIDETMDIARKFKSKIIEARWRDDFSWARNISLENATCEWILWLDADDIVSKDSLQLLDRLKKESPKSILGFIVRNERPNNTGTEFIQARMFPNRRDLYFERKIHEQMMPSALRLGFVMEKRDVVIEHHGYADPETLKKKALRNVKMLLEEYNAIGPDSIMAVEIADSYLLIENHDEARKWYQKTIDLPECEKITPAIAAHAHYGLGNIYNSEKKFDRALFHLKEALRLSPWRADVLYSMAVAEELNGSSKEAVENLKKILEMSPVAGQVGVDFRAAKIKAALRLIRILVEMNKLDESIRVIDDMLVNHPERPEFHNIAGKVYIMAGRLIDGLHAFEKSLAIIIEGNIEAYIGLSIIFTKAGAKDKAETSLRSAEPIFVNDPKYWVFRNYLLSDPLPGGLIENGECERQLFQLKKEFFNVF